MLTISATPAGLLIKLLCQHAKICKICNIKYRKSLIAGISIDKVQHQTFLLIWLNFTYLTIAINYSIKKQWKMLKLDEQNTTLNPFSLQEYA